MGQRQGRFQVCRFRIKQEPVNIAEKVFKINGSSVFEIGTNPVPGRGAKSCGMGPCKLQGILIPAQRLTMKTDFFLVFSIQIIKDFN